MNDNATNATLLTTKQAAQMLGVSRMQMVRYIQSGKIVAEKVGRSYVIREHDLDRIFRPLSERDRARVGHAVDRVVKDYGETIRLLGNA